MAMAGPPSAAWTSPLPHPGPSLPSPSSPASPSSPLLRLTPRIRQRIYRYLGLASWNGRPHTFYLHAGHLKLRHRRGLDFRFVPDPHSFHGLLQSCRALHTETATLLYSANHFVLYYFGPGEDSGRPTLFRPLQTLHALTASSLLSLSNLKIVLNEAACHELAVHNVGGCCLDGRGDPDSDGLTLCQQRHQGLHRPPLLSLASMGDYNDERAATHSLMEEWHSAAARLLSHIAPGRLALSVVCDIDPKHPQALDIAISVVTPIRLLPPSHLKECRIRLAKTPDIRLRKLAEDTVFYACGIPAVALKLRSSVATTLATLPRELRIRILEYTDLITPRRQVIWARQDRAYTVRSFSCDPDAPPDDLHSDQFSECWRDAYGRRISVNGCFCRRRHAAFSLGCKCWFPPGPSLFLLSRALYQDAQFVFFSGNRFIVHDYNISPAWVLPLLEMHEVRSRDLPVPTYPYSNERFAACHFLREVIPTHSLPHLQFLELVFPLYLPHSWPEAHHPVMQDWWETVHWLEGNINLSRLTIRLMVAEARDAPYSYYHTRTSEEGETVMTAFSDLMRPFKRLADNGLARFYAHFPYPWEWTEESRTRRLHGMRWLVEEMEALKKRAELHVMGLRYESLYANGRKEPELSDWVTMTYGGY